MSVPFLVPKPHQAVPEGTGRPPASPVDVYIDHLGIGSRRGMKDGLDTVATFLSAVVGLRPERRDKNLVDYRGRPFFHNFLQK